ncbi:hypothetical protein [uncultured Bacteroides sp.]|uniref:hypothetical protein n=1 Tax=uncultured Bacteroides sp. TaxID=162156 RepID=UPI0025E93411|nr:hypothetical protein [uncultured Bacteroides sp.]
MKSINNWAIKNKHYFLSITWLVLIVLFTYTPLVHHALKISDVLFVDEYCKNQQCGLSLLVNLGLLLMVVFDYIGAGKHTTTKLLVLVLCAVFVLLGIYLHTGIYVAKELSQYVYPISENNLSMILHIFFFCILLHIKIESMEEQKIDNMVIQEEY